MLIALALLFLFCLLCVAYGYFIEPRRLVVNHTELRIRNWDPVFDGLKVVMISDLHGGSNAVDEAKLRLIVEKANEQNADLIVLLGDYVSQRQTPDTPIRERGLLMPMEVVADNLAGLSAKHGVFAVLGNHDGWYDTGRVKRELERIGVRVLENEVATIEKNGHRLRIVGYEDHMKIRSWKEFYENSRMLLPADDTTNLIALEHSPDILKTIVADPASTSGLKLILAGHTHGGQIWFPVIGAPIVPSSYGQKYAAGHVHENGIDMFVTTGVGTSVMPFRFMVPPEIAVLTIRSEPAA